MVPVPSPNGLPPLHVTEDSADLPVSLLTVPSHFNHSLFTSSPTNVILDQTTSFPVDNVTEIMILGVRSNGTRKAMTETMKIAIQVGK